MALLSKSLPNLIGGVSQQPDAIRYDNQCDAQDNAYPSVLDGLIKRPPTEHVANINSSATGNAEDFFVHTINRDSSIQDIVVIKATTSAADLKVNKVDGTAMTIKDSGGAVIDAADLTYLHIDSASSLKGDTAIRAITIADYTFIVNRTKTVAMTSDTDSGGNPDAIFFVKQGDYGTQYTATVTKGGTEYTTVVETGDGSSEDHREDIDTTSIAEAFRLGTNTHAPSLTITLTNSGIHSAAGTTISRSGSVIRVVSSTSADFTVNATDGLGDAAFHVFKEEVQNLTDLPTSAPHHFRIKVIGDATDTRDDYYVRFVAEDASFGAGTWQEYRGSKDAAGSALKYKIDPATMPHVLIRNGNEYLFGPCNEAHALLPGWGERNAGDDVSNADPTFVTKTINDIFLFKNRLGFIADENVILSEVGEFFNFYRTTVTDLLDTAPIDVASTHSTVSILTSAIPFHRQLVLFSEQTQFILNSGNQVFSPKTVSMTKTTNYESISHVRPVTLGHSIYFGFTRGDYSGLRQYYLTGGTEEVFDAADISGQVPNYINGEIRDMAGSSHEDVLCVLSDGDRRDLYIYKFYDQAKERLQSSWSRFRFSSTDAILGIEFIDTTLYIVTKRSDGIFLDKMRMETGLTDSGVSYRTHLDRRTDQAAATPAYNSTTGETTITMPYKAYTGFTMEVVTKAGERIPVTTQTNDSNQIKVGVDLSSTNYWVGVQYEMVYTFSDLVMRESARTGGENIIAEGRVQVRHLTINFSDSSFFKVEITPDYRDKSTHVFTGRRLGSGGNLIGSVPLEDGEFRVPVHSKADQVLIECKNDSPLPCALMSAEFEVSANARSRRFA